MSERDDGAREWIILLVVLVVWLFLLARHEGNEIRDLQRRVGTIEELNKK